MSDREHARELVALAELDLRALHGMLDPVVFADEIFGFHAQQCVEKCLKAWVAALGHEYPRTHDLRFLFDLSGDLGIELSAHRDLESLSVFAVQLRYEALGEDSMPLDRPGTIMAVSGLLAQARAAVAD